MNQFLNDLKTLVKNNWKIILVIVLVTFFLSSYDAIKAGIIDGWQSK
jgi:hypothetical protein